MSRNIIHVALMALAIGVTQTAVASAQSVGVSPLTQEPARGVAGRHWRGHGRFERRARFARRLFHGVRLSREQRHQIREIHRSYTVRLRYLHATHDRSQVRSLRRREIRHVRNVMTPEQRQRFDANLYAIRAHRRGA